jgi:hypothetical protein
MGRSIPTDEPVVSYPSLIDDTSMRLQQLVNGWRGAERGESLTAQCLRQHGWHGRNVPPVYSTDLVLECRRSHFRASCNRTPLVTGTWYPLWVYEGVAIYRWIIAARSSLVYCTHSEAGAHKLRAALTEALVLEEVDQDLKAFCILWRW